MSWIMSSRKYGANISFYIGSIKVANILMIPPSGGGTWRASIRFMDGVPENKVFNNVSDAMRHLHDRLNPPPQEEEEMYDKATN